MRNGVLMILLLIPMSVSAQNVIAPTVNTQEKGILVRNITIEGFVLGDKDQFLKIFKPYRNKYLTARDIDSILQKIKDIYEMGGYQQLVSITYHLDKHHLVFTALMVS